MCVYIYVCMYSTFDYNLFGLYTCLFTQANDDEMILTIIKDNHCQR